MQSSRTYMDDGCCNGRVALLHSTAHQLNAAFECVCGAQQSLASPGTTKCLLHVSFQLSAPLKTSKTVEIETFILI